MGKCRRAEAVHLTGVLVVLSGAQVGMLRRSARHPSLVEASHMVLAAILCQTLLIQEIVKLRMEWSVQNVN